MSSSQYYPPSGSGQQQPTLPPTLAQPFFSHPAPGPPSSFSSKPPTASMANGGQPPLSLGSLPPQNLGQAGGFRGMHQLTGAPTPPCPVGERQISGSSSGSQQEQPSSYQQRPPTIHQHQSHLHQSHQPYPQQQEQPPHYSQPSFSASSSSSSPSQSVNQNTFSQQSNDTSNTSFSSSTYPNAHPDPRTTAANPGKGPVGNGPGLGIQSSLGSVPSASVGGSGLSKDVPDGVFEFTKRKKWSQLLIHELSDTVVFVLLPLSNGGAKIIYTSPGVEKLLGYKARDIENKPLSEIVHEPDLPPLLSYLHQSILNRTDLSSFHRFLPKFDLHGNGKEAASASPSLSPNLQQGSSGSGGGYSSESSQSESGGNFGTGALGAGGARGRKPSFAGGVAAVGTSGAGKVDAKGKPVLMELRGHGYWGEEVERGPLPLSLTQGNPSIPIPSSNSVSHPSGGGENERCKCFFLMAKRWPSRAGDMLDGFLEEKIENERLRVELMEMLGTDSISDSELDLHLTSSTPKTTERIPALTTQNHHSNAATSMHLPPHLNQSTFPIADNPVSVPILANSLHRPQQLLSQSFSFSSSSYGDEQPEGGAYDDDDSDDNAIIPPVPLVASHELQQPTFSSAPQFEQPMTFSHPRSRSTSYSSSSPNDETYTLPPSTSSRSVRPSLAESSSADSAYLPQAAPKPPRASKPKVSAPRLSTASAALGEDGAPPPKKAKKAKKSAKEDGNHVCVTCGRTDSPEWRKGPLGPKTLCNACGLRYSKSQKDKDGTGAAAGANAAASTSGQKKK